ncbi:MAG: DUF4148 domain-containing protein [Castellaniella sp.]|uniref:DUF4148 domain-containing protein n=1 Tax=Castellaniella sp. TaxID=1955812 RepID=UPI003C715106
MKITAAASIAILSLGLASAGIAQAENNSYPETVTPSTQTRAEVVQDLRLAQSQGLITAGEDNSYPQLQADGPSMTRTQVLKELENAKRAGLVSSGENHNQYPQVL